MCFARQALDDVIEAAKVAPREEIAVVEETLEKMREAVRESEEFAAQGARAAEEAAHAALAAAQEARASLGESEDEEFCDEYFDMAEACHEAAVCEDYVHEQTSAFELTRHDNIASAESCRRHGGGTVFGSTCDRCLLRKVFTRILLRLLASRFFVGGTRAPINNTCTVCQVVWFYCALRSLSILTLM